MSRYQESAAPSSRQKLKGRQTRFGSSKVRSTIILTGRYKKDKLEVNAPRISDIISHWQGEKEFHLCAPEPTGTRTNFDPNSTGAFIPIATGSSCVLSQPVEVVLRLPLVLERRRRPGPEWWCSNSGYRLVPVRSW